MEPNWSVKTSLREFLLLFYVFSTRVDKLIDYIINVITEMTRKMMNYVYCNPEHRVFSSHFYPHAVHSNILCLKDVFLSRIFLFPFYKVSQLHLHMYFVDFSWQFSNEEGKLVNQVSVADPGLGRINYTA